MVNSEIFAKALLQRANSSGLQMSHLKLQKLAYYCQGYHLAQHKEPIFDAPIEAWTHGPVVTDLYHSYKCYGNELIPVPDDRDYVNELSQCAIQIVDFVINKLGSIGAWELRNQTHQEAPWRLHYNQETDEVDGLEITRQELTSFFNEEVSHIQDSAFAKVLDSMECELVEMPETVTNKDEFYEWLKSL